jgi:hypothetical protein
MQWGREGNNVVGRGGRCTFWEESRGQWVGFECRGVVETLRLFGNTRWETLLKTQCWAILFVVLFPCRDEISSVWELYFDSLAYNLS